MNLNIIYFIIFIAIIIYFIFNKKRIYNRDRKANYEEFNLLQLGFKEPIYSVPGKVGSINIIFDGKEQNKHQFIWDKYKIGSPILIGSACLEVTNIYYIDIPYTYSNIVEKLIEMRLASKKVGIEITFGEKIIEKEVIEQNFNNDGDVFLGDKNIKQIYKNNKGTIINRFEQLNYDDIRNDLNDYLAFHSLQDKENMAKLIDILESKEKPDKSLVRKSIDILKDISTTITVTKSIHTFYLLLVEYLK